MRSGDTGTHSNWKRKVELHEAQKIIELPKKEKQINIEPEIAIVPEWIQIIMQKSHYGKIINISFCHKYLLHL